MQTCNTSIARENMSACEALSLTTVVKTNSLPC